MSDTATKVLGQTVSRTQFKALRDCVSLQEAFETKELRDRIAQAIPSHLNPDTMLRTFIQAASKTPLIYKCDLRQSLGAFMSLSYLGLTPGTVLQLAHLIPFKVTRKNRQTNQMEEHYDLNVIIGYPGYLELAIRSGAVKSVHCDVVLPGEHFRAEHGSHKVLEHRPDLDHDTSSLTPRAAYAFVNMADGADQFEVMGWPDVLLIRNRSQAYRTALANKVAAEEKGWRIPVTWTEAPWVRDEREMGKKSAFRRLAKWLPKCPELRAGVALEDAQDGGQIDFGPVIDGTATPIDGIPMRSDEQDDPPPPSGVDPGAAHTDRRPPPARDRPAPAAREADTPVNSKPARQPAPAKTAAPATQEAPEFEAYIISRDGEVFSGPWTSPIDFANRLLTYWQHEARDPDIIQNNADSIDEARGYSAAFTILQALDEEPVPDASTESTQAEPEPEVIAVIEPPTERGRISWPAWIKLMDPAIATVAAPDLDAWAVAHKPIIERAPMSQRAVVVGVLRETYSLHNFVNPPWLALLLTAPASKPAAAETKTAAPPATAAKSPPAASAEIADAEWVDRMIADIGQMNRGAFDRISKSQTVRERMQQLRERDPEQFNRANDAFAARHEELPGFDPKED